MSLLNDALRKNDRELCQIKKINLFRKRPKPRNRGIRKFSPLVIFIVLSSGLVVLGVWYGFLRADPSPIEFKRVSAPIPTEKNVLNKPAPPQKPLQLPLKAEPKTRPTIASTIERKDQGIDKKTFKKNTNLKGHQTKTTKRTISETPTARKKGNKGQNQRVKKGVETPAPAAHQTEDLFYKKAVSYHRQNKMEMAIQMYLEVLAENPEHPGALLNLSSAYIQSSLFTKARPLLKKLQHDDPENPKVLLNFAVMEIGLGRPDKAIRYLEKTEALSEEPLFEIYFHRGVAFSHLEALDEALTWYERAEKLSENNPLLLFNMAVVYDKLAKYEKALRYYVSLQGNAGAPLSVKEKKQISDRIGVLEMFLARR